MRNSSGVLQTTLVARRGPIGGGGYVTRCALPADDGTLGCGTDTYGTFFGAIGDEWTPLIRPGDNIDAADIYFDPAGQGLGAYDWGRVGCYDHSICATNSDVQIWHTMFHLYGTLDKGVTAFKFTNFPQTTGDGTNPNGQLGAWGGNRTRGSAIAIDPNDPDHAIVAVSAGFYRTTDLTTGAGATWSLISTASLPPPGAATQRNLVAFDRSSSVDGNGRTSRIYAFCNSEVYVVGSQANPTATIGNSFSINGTTVTLTGTTVATAVTDINGAAISNIRAFSHGSALNIANSAGGAVTLANVSGTPLTTFGIASASANPANRIGLHVSADGGATWSLVTAGTGTNPNTAGCMDVDRLSGAVFVAGTANSGTQGQLRRYTSAAGGTWTAPATATTIKNVVASPHNAGHIYAMNTGGQLFGSNDNGDTFFLIPQTTGAFTRSDATFPWLENTSNLISMGGMAFDPTTNRIIITEGLSIWYYDNPASTSGTSTAVAWVGNVVGVDQIVTMGIACSPLGTFGASAQDKAGFMLPRATIDARTNLEDHIPSQAGLVYTISMDWAIDDPTFWVTGMTRGSTTGTAEGWFSVNDGRDWTEMAALPTGTGTPNLKAGNIAVSTRLNWVWCGALNSGQLAYTEDGGETWTTTDIGGLNWTNWNNAFYSRVCCIADKNNPGHFYVFCHGTSGSQNSSAIGFWKSTDGGATWTRVFDLPVSHATNYGLDFYHGKLKQPLGAAPEGDFFWSGGGNADGLHKNTNYCAGTVRATHWPKIGPMTEVFAYGFGAPRVAGDYPTILAVGWGIDPDDSTNKYGWWFSYDGGDNWEYDRQFMNGIYDQVLDIAGDPDIFGRWAIAYSGKGVDIIDPELSGGPTPGLRFH